MRSALNTTFPAESVRGMALKLVVKHTDVWYIDVNNRDLETLRHKIRVIETHTQTGVIKF